MSLIASLGIVTVLLLLVYNYAYRRERIVKMSSPQMNNVILTGCVLVYSTIFVDYTQGVHQTSKCQIRSYMLAIGLSMTFGGLFFKTWRVYYIFLNKQMKSRIIKDWALMIMVVILVVLNVIILSTWVVFDPLYIHVYNLTQEASTIEWDIILQYQMFVCESNHQAAFIGSLYVIHGLVLVFGAFLAWETKKVKFKEFNDSQMIGACIYNAAIIALVCVAMNYTIDTKPSALYGVTSGFLVFGTLMTEGIIFMPKIYQHLNSVAPTRSEAATSNSALSTDRHKASALFSSRINNHIAVAKEAMEVTMRKSY
ncbi:PREDICTED: gamma-aminobutyric acid type B receptor subunit 2-like [Priapulus caudatus]|uniref:Gamma-aminobutyric acid type B receptor subunit 2-like n=1 Tax=Priapulus caudatus TaxID=37621 RepID=A0ABM1EXT7_PRICU|nr:PREDICTED: gamma-aminobutyric acid type B receptor subunit 2-like [Priapulus caudatus]